MSDDIYKIVYLFVSLTFTALGQSFGTHGYTALSVICFICALGAWLLLQFGGDLDV